MKIKFTKTVIIAILSLALIVQLSCKQKSIKKIMVDNQFAVSVLKDDTLSVRDLLNKMDTMVNEWILVNEAGELYSTYNDTLLDVLTVKNLFGNIPDISYDTVVEINVNPFKQPLQKNDTAVYVDVERLAVLPLAYDGYSIRRVVMGGGEIEFDMTLTPEVSELKKLRLSTEQITMPNGDDFAMEMTPNGGNYHCHIDLTDCVLVPNEDMQVLFSGLFIFEYDNQLHYSGGHYACVLSASLKNVAFKELTGYIEKPIDSVFAEVVEINYGISGVEGEAWLRTPDVKLSYRNTFGFGADCNVSKLSFYSQPTNDTISLLEEVAEFEVNPTTGDEFEYNTLDALVDQLDVLGQYTSLLFNGRVAMDFGDGLVTIKDDSKVDLALNVNIPLEINLHNVTYNDTIPFSVDGSSGGEIEKFFDEIGFTIYYENHIPLSISLQGDFLKDGEIVASLFEDDPMTILAGTEEGVSGELPQAVITGDKIDDVSSADHMVLRISLNTNGEIVLRDIDFVKFGVKMLTKTTEINIDDMSL